MSGRSAPSLPATTSRRGLVAGLVAGTPIVAYGIAGTLVDGERTHPGELARWLVGAAIVHDVVLAPAVLVAGWALRRLLPARVRPAVRAGLAATGVLALVAWPFVRGYGRDPANPSLLARPYGAGLAAAVAAVWAAVALALAVGAVRDRRRRPHAGRPPEDATPAAEGTTVAPQEPGSAAAPSV